MTHVQPSTAQPSTMPSPLLSLFVNYQSYGESLSSALSSGFVGAGMIHILDKLTKLQNMRFPKAPKAQWTPHRAITARRQQGTVSRDQHCGAACLGKGRGKQGEKPLPELP